MKIVISFILGATSAVLVVLYVPFLLNGGMHDGCQKCSITKSVIHNLSMAVTMFGLDENRYPTSGEGLDFLLGGEYLNRLPKDPWGNPYKYSAYDVSGHSCFTVWSFGSENKPRGKEEYERDIHESNCLTKASVDVME